MRKKVLLLNPPGEKRYIRDYYCSKVSKAWYIYPPVDLLILSGILYEQFDVRVIDAIVRKTPVKKCLEEIKDFSPDAIIFLTGAVSKGEDLEFIKKIKQHSSVLAVASGDYLLEKGSVLLRKEKALDAILLDFTSSDIVSYLNNPLQQLSTIIQRADGNIMDSDRVRQNGEFSIPIPRHELFLNKRYTYPFIRKYPFATVLTDYGCPFKCPFCVMASIGYKYRPVDNVLSEISYLDRLGVKEIYFADQTFGANRIRTLGLLNAMARQYPKLGWVCFSRVDITDEEMLKAMKEAGCHTIIYGIESGNKDILKRFKGIGKERMRQAIRLCKKYKIRVVGTFIIGLPGETEESIRDTITFFKECDFDYISFNIAIPRANTELRREAIRDNLWLSEHDDMDQSGTYAVMGTGHMSKEEVFFWRRQAVKEFYLRPVYLFKRLFSVKSWQEFKINILEGLSLIKGTLKS
ncbi:MAG: radical SAM protein [Candidatus Omnitrophica bacterium]|nr:radical SAM protein [Candidatus Omnitrophota bacterium]MDD5591967.1 radical SAM protein [Candidatus Omnitrophota bacterium]